MDVEVIDSSFRRTGLVPSGWLCWSAVHDVELLREYLDESHKHHTLGSSMSAPTATKVKVDAPSQAGNLGEMR